MKKALSVLLAVLLLCPTSVALAQQQPATGGDTARAQELFEQGVRDYEAGRFEAAAREFEESYRVTSAPEILYNIGQSYERAGLLAEALDALRRYLAAMPVGSDTTELRERIARIEGNLRRSSVRFEVRPAGAEVVMDGRSAGHAPLDAVTVDPGDHTVVIQHDGYRTYRGTFSVVRSRLARVVVDLAPTEGGEREHTVEEHHNYLPSLLVFTAAGAAAITGAALGFFALSRADQAHTSDDDSAHSATSLALGADVAFGAAAVLAIVGVVVLVNETSSERGTTIRSRRDTGPHLDVGLGSLGLHGTF